MLEGAAWVDEHSYEYDGAGEGASQGKPPKAPTGKTLHGLGAASTLFQLLGVLSSCHQRAW
jgi:hypothetical protein